MGTVDCREQPAVVTDLRRLELPWPGWWVVLTGRPSPALEALGRLGPGVPHRGQVLGPCGDLSISSCDIRHIRNGHNVEASRNTEANQALWFRFASCLRLEVGSWSFPDASLPTSGAFNFTAAGGMPSVWAVPSPPAGVCPPQRPC